ncbi:MULTISPECIES: SGNH/GDSL hydrolase family protein [Shouchella]|uniref:SGNH/GDSL hydrolase family protein n=2 Tax=Shouchella TaxID=2893057 RepID=A0ABY7W699_9BACI|nr:MULTISPECIES: SGNH/GDSL hydrolase family protein [Shouchella]MED4130212.1 SGNH/GDSL hydrolase family protein [Shouchella miscanthi]WDF04472.1 SGNH/GDSL hydrolase family protein [Shouchella hunanensis]GAF23742.1 hypothetical protein JCM19047_3584 [Bacillus sp. JCM 19047]
MLKKIGFPLVILFSITGIILSYMYNQQQIAEIADEATSSIPVEEPETNEETEVEPDIDETVSSGWLGSHIEKDSSLTQKVVFVGSSSFTSTESDRDWPSLVMKETAHAITATKIDYEVLTYSGETVSSSLIADTASDITAAEPTILIVESFSLNDNQYYLPFTEQESVDNLSLFLTHMESELPDTEIIVVPSNPFPNALHYLERKNTLDEQASSLPGTYVDHWVAWPTGEGLESVTQNLRPNDEGQEIWSEAFLEFFIDS